MLRWLALRDLRNRASWAARQPRFWIILIAFVVLFLPLAFLPPDRETTRGTFYATFDEVWLFVMVSQLMTALFAGMVGTMATIVSRPVVEIVYPAPLNRGAFLRARVRRSLLGVLGGVSGFGILLAGIGGEVVRIPAWQFAVGFAAAFLPAAGFWFSLGITAAYASSRIGERAKNVAVIAGILLLFAELLSLTLDPRGMVTNPLIVLIARLSIVPTELLLGIPLNSGEALVAALFWVAFLGIAATALGWPYDVYEDSGTHGVPSPSGFSRERPAAPGFWHDLSLRLRVRYVDLGSGGAALLARNLTVSLRGPNIAIQVMMGGMLVFVTFPFAFSGGSFWFRFSFPVIMAGIVAGTIGSVANVISSAGVHDSAARLLPLRGADVYVAFVGPTLLSSVGWALVVVVAIGIAGGTPVLILLAFLTIVSVGAWTSSWSFFVSTFLPSGQTSPEAVGPTEGWALLLIASVFVVMLELTPLILVSGDGPITSLLAVVTGVNLALAAVSAGGGVALLRQPPRR